jgi:aminopeptidase YwaD
MNTTQRLSALCDLHPDRHVGGPGNQAANRLFAEEVGAAGFSVERIGFEAAEWVPGEAWLDLNDRREPLHAGPFSPAFAASALLVCIATVAELEALDTPGAIVLLHGEIAAEQLTPRRYPFYNTDSHKRILTALDRARPAAVIAATDRTPMAAALCPFPLFEDADLGHPSAYLHARDGDRLLPHAGEFVRPHIDSQQRRVPAEQVVALKRGTASDGRRVVVSAHIDSRYGTPGALDNAGGVCVLLALADLLGKVTPAVDVELVPFNGEDDFAAPGEMAYLGRAEAALDDIALVINVDAVGRRGDQTAISFYGCSDAIRLAANAASASIASVVEGPEWPMSDHMIFAMRGIPAIAITSTGLAEIAATVAHTAEDVPALVDPMLINEAARFIALLIGQLDATAL